MRRAPNSALSAAADRSLSTGQPRDFTSRRGASSTLNARSELSPRGARARRPRRRGPSQVAQIDAARVPQHRPRAPRARRPARGRGSLQLQPRQARVGPNPPAPRRAPVVISSCSGSLSGSGLLPRPARPALAPGMRWGRVNAERLIRRRSFRFRHPVCQPQEPAGVRHLGVRDDQHVARGLAALPLLAQRLLERHAELVPRCSVRLHGSGSPPPPCRVGSPGSARTSASCCGTAPDEDRRAPSDRNRNLLTSQSAAAHLAPSIEPG